MKRLCIIPFTNAEYSLINHLTSNYEITALISPKGIGNFGMDIGHFRNQNDQGYKITNSIDKISDCDTVLISDVSMENKTLYLYAIKAIETAIACQKEILCFLRLSCEDSEKYNAECVSKGLYFREFNTNTADEIQLDRKIHKITAPVIYIGEAIHGCRGYDVFLDVINRMRMDGKRVLGISEDSYNELFSIKTLRFWKGTNPRDAAYRINKIVYDLFKENKSDIIVIKLSEPMIKYDEDNPYDFGLSAYLMSQAVPGDGCVYCAYIGTPYTGFWNTLNDNFLSKFGYPLIAVDVSNQIIDKTSPVGVPMVYINQNKAYDEVVLLNKCNQLPFYVLSDSRQFESFYQKELNNFFDIPYGVI